MLSLFPSLLSYQELSPLLIRIVLAITVAYFGYQKVMKRGQSSGSNSVLYGVVEIILAILIFIGLYTQLAAFAIAIILLIKLGFKARKKELLSDGINYYILLLVMAISLMVTSAGWYAFDLPL